MTTEPLPQPEDHQSVDGLGCASALRAGVTRDLDELIAETSARDPEFAAALRATEES